MLPHGKCVVTSLHAAANSAMDDGTANFEAAQYPVRYSNFTLDDELLSLMGEINNAVPLILHPFHPKGKMLCCTGHLN
jgi:hypothetical protein